MQTALLMVDNAGLSVELCGVIITLVDGHPAILQINGALLTGQYSSAANSTLEDSFRQIMFDNTGLELTGVQQLYAIASQYQPNIHGMSIAYLAFSQCDIALNDTRQRWTSWYDFLPWEDWRDGRPALLDAEILPALLALTDNKPFNTRIKRIHYAFGTENNAWDTALVRERYELMMEAGLLAESIMEGHAPQNPGNTSPGIVMPAGQRRMVAAAMGALRKQFKIRPIVEPLMPEKFTLTQLQQCSEAVLGQKLHKQNFRRQIDKLNLVVPLGRSQKVTGGRPAALYRLAESGEI